MNRITGKAIFAFVLAGVLTACCSQKASADTATLELTGVGGNNTDGVYTYPYIFSINSEAPVDLMCISFDNEIYFNESWTATITGISGAPEDEAAWLMNDAQLNTGNNNADQLAAWSLFASDTPTPTSDEIIQLGLAKAFVNSNPNDTSFYDLFTLYTPEAGTQSTGGTPQTFIGELEGSDATPEGGLSSPVVTPEPRSLLLLGSGLFAFVAARHRKRQLS